MASGFVYLFPLHGEDWLKVGISTDPLRRAREFSRRFFDLFDFDRVLLLETGSPRDAAAVERQLRGAFREHRAPMPLTVRTVAGGHTEWYRGAYPALSEALRNLEAAGYTLHGPGREWFAATLHARRDELHDWSSQLLRQHFQDPDATPGEPLPADAAALLLDNVEAYRHFGIGVREQLPAALQAWYDALPPLGPDKAYTGR
jgi:hypothetical protein